VPDETTYPSRELRDPAELRALAHPVRLRILEALAIRGQATATQLAEWVDESPANCSWHLRQLARYGYIVEAGGGRGRQRPWKIVPRGHRWGERAEPAASALALAEDAAAELVVDLEYAAQRDWLTRRRGEPESWRQGAFLTQNVAFLTAAELAELAEVINAAVVAHPERLGDPATRPQDARPIRLVAWGFPSRDPTQGSRDPNRGSAG
jgi:DNA-binding transcriptional ArsR family regulator